MSRRRHSKGYYDMVRDAYAEQPSEVNAQFTIQTEFYKDILLNIAKGRFDIQCPEWWDKDFMLDCLLLEGKFIVTESDKVGVAPFQGNISGTNMFLRGSQIEIVNPILGNWMCERYKDAVVVYLYDDRWFRSITNIISYYAQRLANIDCSIDVNLMNTRVPWIFNAENTKQAKEAKLIYKKVSEGQPAVFTKVRRSGDLDREGGLDVSSLPVKNNYVTDKLIEAKRAIISEYLTYLGINSVSYEKKERMVTSEVEMSQGESAYNIEYPKDNLKDCCDATNEMFPSTGLRITVKEGVVNEEVYKDVHQEADEESNSSGDD